MSGAIAIGASDSGANSWDPPPPASSATTVAPAAGADPRPADRNSIIFDPANLDFGRVCTSSVVRRSVRITNDSDSTIVLLEPQTTCGCTVATLAQRVLAPGASVAAEIQLTVPSYPAAVHKRVRFRFGGDVPDRIVDVTASAERLIVVHPERLRSDTVASAEIEVESTDGHPFRVLGALPPVMSVSAPTESASGHRFWIDPILWNALGRPNRVALLLDDPSTEQIVLEVESPRAGRKHMASDRDAPSVPAAQRPGVRNGSLPHRDVRILELGPIPRDGMVESLIVIDGQFQDVVQPRLTFDSPLARCELSGVIKSADSWSLNIRFQSQAAQARDVRAPLFIEIGSTRVICVVLASISEN